MICLVLSGAEATSVFLRLLPTLGCMQWERPGAIGAGGGGGGRGGGRGGGGGGVSCRTDVAYITVSQSAVSSLTLILLPTTSLNPAASQSWRPGARSA